MTDAKLMQSIRHNLNLTQTEMAEKLGFSGKQSISRIENGGCMSKQVRKHLETIRSLHDEKD